MVILYKNVVNTVRFVVSTSESMSNGTVSFTLGTVEKTSSATSKWGAFTIVPTDLASIAFGSHTAVVDVKRGDELLQRLHVQVRVASEGVPYDNAVYITLVERCNNQTEERYADIYECYLHDGTMYMRRSGSGTILDPYVYSEPVIPAVSKIYIDVATGKWYRWNVELATPAYTEFGASAITNTSQLTNDGEDGVNPFVSTDEIGDLAASLDIDEDWVSGTSYAVGDTCINSGLWYKCVTANDDAEFDASKWTTISVKANLGVSTTLLGDGTLQVNFGVV